MQEPWGLSVLRVCSPTIENKSLCFPSATSPMPACFAFSVAGLDNATGLHLQSLGCDLVMMVS